MPPSARQQSVYWARPTFNRATSFVSKGPKASVDNPEITVVIKSEDGKKEERVQFARSGSDVLAGRPDLADLAKIDASTVDNIIKALEALK